MTGRISAAHRVLLLGALAGVAWLSAFTPAPAYEPQELIARIHATELDPASAISVRDLDLEIGPAVLAMQRGFLVPARLPGGRIVELVFIGQARFRHEPVDPIEAGQIELFTGETTVDAAVEEAVLVLANEETVARLLDRPQQLEARPALLERADQIHRQWLEKTERRNTGVDAGLFKALVGDSAFQSYFAIWCRSFEVGDFLYRLDPEEVEQVTLASFSPLTLTDWERQKLMHYMRVQRRKGRWLGLRMEDMGGWDIWSSTSWTPEGEQTPGNEGFEAEHYELDVTIRRDRMRLDGVARITLKAQASGRRAVRLEMMRDLGVEAVRDGQGRELFYFRAGEEVVVLLPEAVAPGDEVVLEVEYDGRGLAWSDGRNFDLTDTGTWYPHGGTVDRATYDVKLRWPRKYQLFASGSLVEEGQDGGYRWQHRRLGIPSIAFSFVLGRFDVETARMGDVDVTAAFMRSGSSKASAEVRAQVVESIRRALAFFEETFGPYPLEELTVTTVPRQYSQSYLGFVTLARSITRFEGEVGSATSWQRDTTIAHELAHQWWGNLVGWWSYRDQWLSEGMANYAAALFDAHVHQGRDNLLAVMSSGWQESLTQRTLEGRTVESLGPIVLGNRLNSTRAANGYRPIVYRKGAVVLAMLARSVGEERFHQMLHSLVQAASNQVLTTDAFLKSIERMSGMELDGFARQYVYGTGIPHVYYDYELSQKEDGGWSVRGEARLLATPRYRYEIVRSVNGLWDVNQHAAPELDDRPTKLMVPFELTLALEDGEHDTPATLRDPRPTGQIELEGKHDRFEIETAREPSDLRLDPEGEILARFYSASTHPKRYLRYEAEDLALDGSYAEAEARYRKALEMPSDAPTKADPLGSPRQRGGGDFREDVRLRLGLVRLYIDDGRDTEARQELDAVERSLRRDHEDLLRVEREALRSRLDIREGDYASARRRLKKMLRLAEQGDTTSFRNMLWQIQINSERHAVTEAYALLAIAAHETGRREELRWAISAARSRGVDVTLLERAAD